MKKNKIKKIISRKKYKINIDHAQKLQYMCNCNPRKRG